MQIFLDKLLNTITDFGLKLIAAFFVLIIGIKIGKIVSKHIRKSRFLENVDIGVRTFASNAVKWLIYVITVVSAAAFLGVPYASFIAVLGSVGVAVGLGFQGALSNIAAGILILLNKPFKVGDFIESCDFTGTVRDIGFFNTSVVTLDNKVVSYPNSMLSNTGVINYSAMDKRRVDLPFSVGYGSDLDKVREIMLKTAYENPMVLKEPPAKACVTAHLDSAVEFTLFAWCKTPDYLSVKFDLLERMKKAFDKNGIEIPYKKIDINVADRA